MTIHVSLINICFWNLTFTITKIKHIHYDARLSSFLIMNEILLQRINGHVADSHNRVSQHHVSR